MCVHPSAPSEWNDRQDFIRKRQLATNYYTFSCLWIHEQHAAVHRSCSRTRITEDVQVTQLDPRHQSARFNGRTMSVHKNCSDSNWDSSTKSSFNKLRDHLFKTVLVSFLSLITAVETSSSPSKRVSCYEPMAYPSRRLSNCLLESSCEGFHVRLCQSSRVHHAD